MRGKDQKISIDCDARGRGTVKINDQDISEAVMGVQFIVDPQTGVQLVLLMKPGDIQVEAEGIVAIPAKDEIPEATVLRRASGLVAALDPRVLEAEALGSLEWGEDQNVISQVLKLVGRKFDNAAHELESNQTVPGAADGRYASGTEGPPGI